MLLELLDMGDGNFGRLDRLVMLVTSSVRCSPNAPTLVSMFSQPPSRWIDLAMYAFRPPAQKNKSLCLEFLSEALLSCPFKFFSNQAV